LSEIHLLVIDSKLIPWRIGSESRGGRITAPPRLSQEMVNEFSATQNHWWISGTRYEGAIGCAVMRETNPRKRLLAHRIDAKAHEILASCKPWHPGIVEFSSPFTDLTPEEEDFIVKRISRWEFEIIRQNGRET
jgi:hypothetical protein